MILFEGSVCKICDGQTGCPQDTAVDTVMKGGIWINAVLLTLCFIPGWTIRKFVVSKWCGMANAQEISCES